MESVRLKQRFSDGDVGVTRERGDRWGGRRRSSRDARVALVCNRAGGPANRRRNRGQTFGVADGDGLK